MQMHPSIGVDDFIKIKSNRNPFNPNMGAPLLFPSLPVPHFDLDGKLNLSHPFNPLQQLLLMLLLLKPLLMWLLNLMNWLWPSLIQHHEVKWERVFQFFLLLSTHQASMVVS